MARRPALTKWVLTAFVCAAGLLVDQATKRAVEARLPLGEIRRILPFLSLQHTRNTGVAFGLFAGRTWLFVIATSVAVIAVLVFVWVEKRPIRAAVAGGLILAGALGNNLVDRVRQGYVTDFIKFPHWPNFNIADILLVLGVVLLIIMFVIQILAEKKGAGST